MLEDHRGALGGRIPDAAVAQAVESFARDAGLRIDHFLLSTSLKERLVAAEVDRAPRSWEKTSDHTPVWIELADE